MTASAKDYTTVALKRWKHARRFYVRWTPHPVIVTIRDIKDYIRVLIYSYYTTITGWGVLVSSMVQGLGLGAWPSLHTDKTDVYQTVACSILLGYLRKLSLPNHVPTLGPACYPVDPTLTPV